MRQVMLCAFAFILFPTLAKALAEPRVRHFRINFVILTPSIEANTRLNQKFFQSSIQRLNENFSYRDGRSVVKFEIGNVHYRDAIDGSSCPLLGFGLQTAKPVRAEIYQAYRECDDSRIKDPSALNVYVFESTWDAEEPWKSSYAFFNYFRNPFVFLNWETFSTGYKVPDVHEMGHILGGLFHLEACGSTDDTPTNVMAGLSDDCDGTAGDRSLGFEDWQLRFVQFFSGVVESSLN